MRGTGAPRLIRVLSLCGGRLHLSCQWDVHHLWVGAYWDLRYDNRHNGYRWQADRRLYVWICLLPTLPLRLSVPWPGKEKSSG